LTALLAGDFCRLVMSAKAVFLCRAMGSWPPSVPSLVSLFILVHGPTSGSEMNFQMTHTHEV